MLKKNVHLAFKVLIVSAFGIFLWYEVFQKQDSDVLWAAFLARLSVSNPSYFIVAVALMPLNWGLEAYKWWALVNEFEKISFRKAYSAVLAGLSIGIFTPSRIGEYGGRALLVKSNHIVESVVATLLGSMSQFLATLCFGYIGVVYFLKYFNFVSGIILWLLVLLGIFSFLLSLFLFYNFDIILRLVKRIYKQPFFQNSFFVRLHTLVNGWLKHVKVLRNYTSKQLSLALFTALLRYIVYSLQYYLLLRFMGIEVGLVTGAACIATVFLLQTSIPLPPVTGLITRGGTALYVWQFFSANQVAILATTFGLWLLNVVVPALIGLVVLVQVKSQDNINK
jgi:uncharacterized protein (TIRG00374 family)